MSGESIRSSRDKAVLVLPFCVHPCPSLLSAQVPIGEVLPAVQGMLPFPGQTPLGFGGKEITDSLCHRHVEGSLGALTSKAICGSIGTKLHSRKLGVVSGHREDCVNNRIFFLKSHHISTLSQVRGLQRVRKEAHRFHLGLFRPLKKTNKIN